MSQQLLIGLLSLLILFLASRTTASMSTSEITSLITNKLIAAGYGTQQAIYWSKVSKLETGYFTSTLCKKYNNLFGMMWDQDVSHRYIQTSNGKFEWPETLADSVDLQIEYLHRFNYPHEFYSLSEFVNFLKSKNYFGTETADSYFKKLNSIR